MFYVKTLIKIKTKPKGGTYQLEGSTLQKRGQPARRRVR